MLENPPSSDQTCPVTRAAESESSQTIAADAAGMEAKPAILLFYTALGVMPSMAPGASNDALALLLFLLVVPAFSFLVGPLFTRLSRAHEFEADAFAVHQTSARDLSTALLKLYEDNASTLTPDPVYVKFHYSHPPASERLSRLHG